MHQELPKTLHVLASAGSQVTSSSGGGPSSLGATVPNNCPRALSHAICQRCLLVMPSADREAVYYRAQKRKGFFVGCLADSGKHETLTLGSQVWVLHWAQRWHSINQWLSWWLVNFTAYAFESSANCSVRIGSLDWERSPTRGCVWRKLSHVWGLGWCFRHFFMV